MPTKSQPEAPAPRLKLVIRRLPPTLPEPIFWQAVSPWVTDDTCRWKRYIKGRPSTNPNEHAVHSRAYCLMASVEALVELHRGFDGHVFRSKTGAEYQAVVEYAPIQKTPLNVKIKTDARQGTIDEDPDYKSFLESLTNPQAKPPLEVPAPAAQPTSTPLLDHLRAKGLAKAKKAQTASSTSDIGRHATLAPAGTGVSKKGAKEGAKDSTGKDKAKGKESTSAGPAASSGEPGPSGSAKKAKKKKGQPTGESGRDALKDGSKAGQTSVSAAGSAPHAGPTTITKILKPDRPGQGPIKQPPTGPQSQAQASAPAVVSGRVTPVLEGPAKTPVSPGRDSIGGANRGRGRGRGRGGAPGGVPRNSGAPPAVSAVTATETSTPGVIKIAKPDSSTKNADAAKGPARSEIEAGARGGRGAAPGGAELGRGGGRGRGRTARNAVTEILMRNAEGETKRGGGRSHGPAGQGKGESVQGGAGDGGQGAQSTGRQNVPDPRTARIDG